MSGQETEANSQLKEQEAAHRRDDTLRRALNTPPQPRKNKANGGDSKAASKPRQKKERES
jgi:hypothetical protein